MSNKVIFINLPHTNHKVEQLKHALQIFDIYRVHLEKNQAVVQFNNLMDFQAFLFTNAHFKIPSLGGASYSASGPDFKWEFPPNQTSTISDLKQMKREDTEPDEQHAKKVIEPQQKIPNLDIDNHRQEFLSFQDLNDLHSQLRQQRRKEQEERKKEQEQIKNNNKNQETPQQKQNSKQKLIQNSDQKQLQKSFIKKKLQKWSMMINQGQDLLKNKLNNMKQKINQKVEGVNNYQIVPGSKILKQIIHQNRFILLLIIASFALQMLF